MTIDGKSKFSLTTALLIVVAFLAAAGCFIRLSYYYDSCDVPFQIMTGWGDFRTSVVAPLSAWLTGIVGPLLNYDLMPMRYFACTCYIIAIFIGAVPVWQLSRDIDFTLCSTILALLLFPWCRIMEFEYSWDVYATLLIMTVFALSASYLMRRARWKIILAAAIAGATMWVRLPSAIVGLVPAIAAVYAATGLGRKLLALITVSAIYSIVAVGLLVALYGSPCSYHEYWTAYKISAHPTQLILLQYATIITRLYLFVLIAAGIYCVLSRIMSFHRYRLLWFALVFLLAMSTVVYTMKLFLWSIFPPLLATLSLFIIILALKRKQYNTAVIALLILVSSISATFWSNIELTRMIVYPFIPAIAWITFANGRKRQLAAISTLCLACVMPTLYSAISGSVTDGRIRLYSAPEEAFVDGNDHIRNFVILDRLRPQYRRVIDRFTPYASDTTYTKAVMRGNEHDFMFEYMFDAKTPVFSNYWDHDTLHYNRAYLDGFNAYIDTLRPPTAILVMHRDMPKPPVAFEYENRYIPVYSDSDFTIVVKPAPAHAD